MMRSRRALLFPVIVVVLAGCRPALGMFGLLARAVGPKFSPIAVPRDKAVVYIYRVGLCEPRGFWGGPHRCAVRSGYGEITNLRAGEYLPYLAELGEREFSLRVGNFHVAITEQLRAGQTYYLKAGFVYAFNSALLGFGRPTLLFVTRDVGEREIQASHLAGE